MKRRITQVMKVVRRAMMKAMRKYIKIGDKIKPFYILCRRTAECTEIARNHSGLAVYMEITSTYPRPRPAL